MVTSPCTEGSSCQPLLRQEASGGSSPLPVWAEEVSKLRQEVHRGSSLIISVSQATYRKAGTSA